MSHYLRSLSTSAQVFWLGCLEEPFPGIDELDNCLERKISEAHCNTIVNFFFSFFTSVSRKEGAKLNSGLLFDLWDL